MIGIIDCGINNIKSLLDALDFIKISYRIVDSKIDLKSHENFILPGVGSFDAGINALKKKDLFDSLREEDFSKKKILGICLGMQLLGNSSEGKETGLGLVDANFIHLKNLGVKSKIPHVGFNEIVSISNSSSFLEKIKNKDFYFIHSYAAKINDDNVMYANTEYENLKIVAAFNYKNIYGTQFHPEKSGIRSLALIENIFKNK